MDITKIPSYRFALDKPSLKLLNFMAKHYWLKDYNQQDNKFVLYNEYFQKDPWSIQSPLK